MGGVIDYLANPFWPEAVRRNYVESSERERMASVGRVQLEGREPADFIQEMDEAGVDKVLVVSIFVWNYKHHRPNLYTPWEEVGQVVSQYPNRLYGLYGVDPRKGMQGVAELERAVREYGFKGIHIHPQSYGPPNHAHYYPFYAKCQELNVAAVVSMGHTLELSPADYGRPIHLDDVALYFPGLRIVCAHTGWPWVEEAIALVSKHENLFLGTSAHAPKYWKPEMVQYLNSRRGRDKVLFGTDWPMLPYKEALAQVDALGLKEESKRKLLHDNAARVFGWDRS